MKIVGFKKIIFSLVILFLVIHFINPFLFSTGVFEFDINLKLVGKGNTVLHIPPLGTVSSKTHFPPVDIHLTLRNINLEQLEVFTRELSSGNQNWPEIMLPKIKEAVFTYFLYLLILAFFLGATSFLLLSYPSRQKKNVLLGGLISGGINCLAIGLLLFSIFFSYNIKAFSEAQYEGILEAAPWVMSAFDEGPAVIKNLGYQFTEVIDNISILQKEVESNLLLQENQETLKILHVSDIHNNPAAFELILKVVDAFNIDLIIDTGDLVDYGTALEMEIFTDFFNSINIPYIFVPGNHESPAAIAALKAIENITVLEEGVVEVAGIKVAGIADPLSSLPSMSGTDDDLAEKVAQQLKELVNNSEGVEIIATHNPDYFKYLREGGNFLLGGHTHTPYIKSRNDYIEINAGTTGSSGIRGLNQLDVTFSLVLITMQYSPEEKSLYLPSSADMIKVENFPFIYSFERHNLRNNT